MPWRLIQFLILFVVFLLFIVFNLENRCDISFGFAVLDDVPVFLTVFFSFLIGLLCTVPFIFGARLRKKIKGAGKENKKSAHQDKQADSGTVDSSLIDTKQYGID